MYCWGCSEVEAVIGEKTSLESQLAARTWFPPATRLRAVRERFSLGEPRKRYKSGGPEQQSSEASHSHLPPAAAPSLNIAEPPFPPLAPLKISRRVSSLSPSSISPSFTTNINIAVRHLHNISELERPFLLSPTGCSAPRGWLLSREDFLPSPTAAAASKSENSSRDGQ